MILTGKRPMMRQHTMKEQNSLVLRKEKVMRTADYIFRTLADWGVKHVFFVSGGGAMYLVDALGLESRIKYVCALHEQAAVMAAEGYARRKNTPGVALVTTGPGATNAITGVLGAWQDSIPMVVISGQVKTSTLMASFPNLKLRQLGLQEVNIIDVVKPVTKYAALVERPEDIRYHLERAWAVAQSGRPGPVWLDVPQDVQMAEVAENMKGYSPLEDAVNLEVDATQYEVLLRHLKKAERPVLLAGGGITVSGNRDKFSALVEKLQIPVQTAHTGVDLIPSDSPYFMGRPCILGDRGANFILQNSDLLLVLGSRMYIRTIGFAFGTIARGAFRIMVDIDANELEKPTFVPDLKMQCDVGKLMELLIKEESLPAKDYASWFEYCRNIRNEYPVVTPEHENRKDYVSTYFFAKTLGENLHSGDTVVTGVGTSLSTTFQALPVKKGVRMFTNNAVESMGYALPAAVGAAFAAEGKNVIALCGDGCLQMNIQELQTVLNYNLPIKLFVYNNEGYLSIKNTQKSFFGGHLVGSTKESGVILPDLSAIASAYGWKTFKIKNNLEITTVLNEVMAVDGPVFCEVFTDPWEILGPKAASRKLEDGTLVSRPIEDLAPLLPREEFLSHMIVAPLEDD